MLDSDSDSDSNIIPNVNLDRQSMSSSSFNISPVSGSVSMGYLIDNLNALYGLGYHLKLSTDYQYGKTSSYLSSDKKSSWDLSLPSIYITDIPSGAVSKIVDVKLNGSVYTINPMYVSIGDNNTISLIQFDDNDKLPLDFFIYSHIQGNKNAPDLNKINITQSKDGSFIITTSDNTKYTLK